MKIPVEIQERIVKVAFTQDGNPIKAIERHVLVELEGEDHITATGLLDALIANICITNNTDDLKYCLAQLAYAYKALTNEYAFVPKK
jgi:hypothetical protein